MSLETSITNFCQYQTFSRVLRFIQTKKNREKISLERLKSGMNVTIEVSSYKPWHDYFEIHSINLEILVV